MKKILVAFLALFISLPLMAFAPNNIVDEKIAVEITRDNTVVRINHYDNIDISYAVVEYGYVENGEFLSELTQIEVRNNRFTVNSNWTAIKLHQVKYLVGNVYYTKATTGTNTIGSFTGVKRVGFVEIETTAVKTVTTDTLLNQTPGSSKFKYYEFYFNFEKEHDYVHSIDVNYIMNYYTFFGLIKSGSENHTKTLEHNLATNFQGYKLIDGNLNLYAPSMETFSNLQKNHDPNINGNYVARIGVTDVELNANWGSDYRIENFAIIRIRYEVDGEFIIDDVINDPTTPIDDSINWLLDFISNIQKNIAGFINFITTHTTPIIAVAIVIVVGIAYALLSPVFRLAFAVLKLAFTGLSKLFELLFGWLV